MPTTTCSNCRVYVTVPNVETTAPFMCPYCKTPNHILYKCFSCTQISIFDSRAMPRTCPKCFTIVRSSQPLQVPFNERDWLYHVTSTTVARLIRANGLCSTYLRTGRMEPDPNGSFVKDREKRITKVFRETLTKYVVFYRIYKNPKPTNGPRIKKLVVAAQLLSFDEDFADDGSFPDPVIVCPKTASNNDYQVLEKSELRLFDAYAKKNLTGFVRDVTGYTKISKEPQTAQLVDALIAQPHHYLTMLAQEVAEHYFGVEAAITASNVYFLNGALDESVILDGFADYTKLRELGSYVVLRAPRAMVMGLEKDQADYRAVRTPRAVPGNLFQIMINTQNPHVDFKQQGFRSRRENWMTLTDWNG